MNPVTLYRNGTKGKILQWSVEVKENEDGTADILVESGIKDGKMIPAKKTITKGKNIGKANETSPYQQAVSEAESKIKLQEKGAYVRNINEMHAVGVKGSGVPAVMLAKPYDPTLKASNSKNLEKLKIEPCTIVALQDKIDGLRGPVRVTETSVDFFSRSGDSYFPLPHIATSLRKTYDRLGLTGEIWLDGELYTKEISFNSLNGFLRGERKTEEEFAFEKRVKYILYDTFGHAKGDEGYMNRYIFIKDFVDITQGVELVHTEFKEFTQVNVDAFMIRALKEGYEGTMIRMLEPGYENKRTYNLLKYKAFMDEDFEVVGFTKSEAGDTLGAIVFRIPKNAGTKYETFKASLNAPDDECKEVWDNQAKYLGRYGTVIFQDYSEYGVPRIPKCKAFRKAPGVEL